MLKAFAGAAAGCMLVLAATLAFLLTSPVKAADCPPGRSLPELVAVIEKSGGTFIDLIDVNGRGSIRSSSWSTGSISQSAR